MDGSSSKTSNNGQANPYEYENLVTRFESFRVGEDDFLNGQSGTNVPATQNPENDVTDNERSRYQLLVPQETPETSRGFSINSVSNHGDIWGYRYPNNLGESSVSNLNSGSRFFMGSVNFNSNHIDSGDLLENLEGSLSGQRGPNFFCGSSSTSNHVNEYNTVPIRNDSGRNQFEIENHGLFSPNEYFRLNNSGLCNQNGQYSGSDFYNNAGIEMGSNPPDSIFWLMTNEHGSVLFAKLIDSCAGNDQLHLIVSKLWSDIKLFIETAFIRIGSISIQTLVRKLKNTPYASVMTRILSSVYFYKIMTNQYARHVIIQCLKSFDRKSNEILYERTIYYSVALARHELGCISLNECINSIAGNHRDTLLNHIADSSDFLSHDPYGNYVVQHVLRLRNDLLTKKILTCLQGQFINLSTTRAGSHIVQECIESSAFGSSLVVKEILECPKSTLLRLCHNKCGNFVIQKALLKTKIEGQMHLYETLVTVLEQGENELKCSRSGVRLLKRLKEIQEAW